MIRPALRFDVIMTRNERSFDDGKAERLLEIDPNECLSLLAGSDVGRIAIVDELGPAIFPISYRLAVVDHIPVIAIRTRSGGAIDHPATAVCFQIDGVDPGHDGGWSVLVRGVLERVDSDASLDPMPLLPDGRDAWRVIVPTDISGRRLVANPVRWTFNPLGYL